MKKKTNHTPDGRRIMPNGLIVMIQPGFKLRLENGCLLIAGSNHAQFSASRMLWENRDDKFLFQDIANSENFALLVCRLADMAGLRVELDQKANQDFGPTYIFKELCPPRPCLIRAGSQMVFTPEDGGIMIIKNKKIIYWPNGLEKATLPFITGWVQFFELVRLVADLFGLRYDSGKETRDAITYNFFKP